MIHRIEQLDDDPPDFNGCVRLLCAVFERARLDTQDRRVHIAAPAQVWLEAMQQDTANVLEGRRYEARGN